MNTAWNRVPLPDVAWFQEGPGLRNWQWTDQGIKVINGRNILTDGQIDLSNTDKFISWAEYREKYEHFGVALNDILVTSSGTLGKVGRIKSEHLPLVMNTSVIRFRPKQDAPLDRDYLYCFLRSGDFQDQISSYAIGAAQPNYGPSHLKLMTLPLPPLPVQRRIASILSAYDDLIENSQRRIKILESMARALYREWFVHFRFPGHENHPRVASPLGEIPEGWEVKKLADVAVVNRAQINARNAPDELHYIDIASVSPGQIDSVTTYTFADAPGRARRVVQHGDVLWSCVRPNRRSFALVMRPEAGTIASTGFAVLTATKVPFAFLYLATTTDGFVAYLSNNATGAAYPAVTAPTFEKAELVVPGAALLKRFGELATPMLEETHALHMQVRNLRRTRDLLLPRLLSGQIDLDELEAA
jgi:type I restriction enzyme S subunit